MLEGLERIDWRSLGDAYGPAASAPASLRLLTSGRSRDHREAFEELYTRLCHQGSTVYSATAAAVPFLLELAGSREIRCRPAVLSLLADIAGATGYCLAHYQMAGAAERGSAGFLDQMDEERRVVRACRDGVWRGLDLYLELLRETDDELVAEAARVLASLARHACEEIPAEMRGSDAIGRAAAALREAFGTAGQLRKLLVPHLDAFPENAGLIRELAAAEPDLAVRMAAVRCVAERDPTSLPTAALDLLTGLWRDPSPGLQPLGWTVFGAEHVGDMRRPKRGAEHDDEEDEDDDDGFASLDLPSEMLASFERTREWLRKGPDDAERAERVRKLAFDTLRFAGPAYPGTFMPVLRAAFEAWVRQRLQLPADLPLLPEHWALLRSIGDSDQFGDVECDQLALLLAPCVNLKKLWFTPTFSVGDATAAGLPELPNLRDLALASTRLTDAGMEHLARYRGLEALSISCTAVSDASMPVVSRLRRLKRLWAWRTKIGDEGAALIARLPELEDLNLMDTRVGDPGAAALAAVETLIRLDLGGTFVTDAGAAALARLPRLTHLALNKSQIGDEALAALADAPVLEWLCIPATRVTDAGLKHLARIRTLRTVNVCVTAVTAAGVEALRRALPECQVIGSHVEASL